MSWITDYLEYTKDQESPEVFHMWTAMTVIAAVLGRSVWLDRRSQGVTRYKIYPGQLMTVVVAGSAFARKTTAIEIGRDFMKDAGVRIIKGKMSVERFYDKLVASGQKVVGTRYMSAPCVATIYASELSVFLSKANYAEALIDTLMELADAKDETEISFRTSGTGIVKEPCVTMLAATTPIGLGESIPEKAHSAGYLGRVTHVYSEATGKVDPLVDVDDTELDPVKRLKMDQLKVTLSSRLLDYKNLSGAFSYTKDGREWYREWYYNHRTSLEGKGEGWPGRKHDHLLRYAMILRIAKYGDLVLDIDSLKAAALCIQQIEEGHERAFSHIGQGQIARDKERVVQLITRHKGRVSTHILINQLYRYFKDINDMKNTLSTLIEAGIIKRAQEDGVEYWYLI